MRGTTAAWPPTVVRSSQTGQNTPDQGGAASRPRQRRVPLQLIAVLAVQAGLSLRLVRSNTAFRDEALYLWAGHMEWSHWLHGAPIPDFAKYFSGAPSIYPPLAALADSTGGLASARLLSLLFMLSATVSLYAVTRRLFNDRSAFFATALFAAFSATQFLGALATYDSMAVALLALATWLGITAAQSERPVRLWLLALAGSALAAADATKYAATLFDPVVIIAIAAFAWARRGRLAGLLAGGVTLLTLVALLLAALLAGGSDYWTGLQATTLTRAAGNTASSEILYVSAQWIAGVGLLGLIGTVAVWAGRRPWPMRWLSVALWGALFQAPIEQARIHTMTSLFKHVGFGAWFGCIVAGYSLASLLAAVPSVKVPRAWLTTIATTVLCGIAGTALAASHYGAWPDSAAFTARLSALAARTSGPVLLDNSIPQYYGKDLRFRTAITTNFFAYFDPSTRKLVHGPQAYVDAISHGYFSVVALDFSNAGGVDNSVRAALTTARRYRLAAAIPFPAGSSRGSFLIWVRKPASGAGNALQIGPYGGRIP